MKSFKLLAIIALASASLSVSGQARKGSLYINEVMTDNSTNFIDDFGNHTPWIELYNSKFAPLEISSVYITTDTTISPDLWYAVPLHDVNTKIPKRQHVIFWADGKPTRGTFHLNFTLNPNDYNDIYLIDSDKKTLIDHVTVPPLATDNSYARAVDGVTVYDENGNIDIKKTWEVRDDNVKEGRYITPSSNNVIRDRNDKVEKFKQLDPHGFAMAIMAMAIVFSALALLCISFMIINKVGAKAAKVNKMKSHGIDIKETPRAERPETDSGEAIAAIVMALQEHLNIHDNESTILTINKVKRAYSPWSSKIYNMRRLPDRK